MLYVLHLIGINSNERILLQSWEGLQLENHEVDTCYLSVNVRGYKFEIGENKRHVMEVTTVFFRKVAYIIAGP